MEQITNTSHPCYGLNCNECETCIFDRELFADNVRSNEKDKDNMEEVSCNKCLNLIKNYSQDGYGTFDASCGATDFESPNGVRPRRIDFSLNNFEEIKRPVWCPLRKVNGGSGNVPLSLPSPSQVSKPNNDNMTKPQTNLTYSEKRDCLKKLNPHIKWEDIKEGHTYLIPKIFYQSRKIVKVISKTDFMCNCHEISETTGNEMQYACNFYPSDIDAVLLVEIHNY